MHVYKPRTVYTCCPRCQRRHQILAHTIGHDDDWNTCDACLFGDAEQAALIVGSVELANRWHAERRAAEQRRGA